MKIVELEQDAREQLSCEGEEVVHVVLEGAIVKRQMYAHSAYAPVVAVEWLH